MDGYFESEEFRNILKSYEDNKADGLPCYMDSDDFIDVIDYYMRERRFNDALQCSVEGLTIHPADSSLLGMKISALVNLGKSQEAREELKGLNAEDNYDYYYFRAQITLDLDDDCETADVLFHKWMALEKQDIAEDRSAQADSQSRLSDDYMHIIACFSELTNADDSVGYIEKWVGEYEKDCAPIGNADADIEIAHICHEEGLIELEEHLYTEFLDTNPYLDSGWTYLASIQHMDGKIQDAINSANFALAINPDDTYTMLLRAHSYYMLDDYKLALKDYLKYEKLTGDKENAHIIGRCYIMLGMTDLGYKALELASAINMNNLKSSDESRGTTWAFIAQAFMDGKFYDEALSAIDKALALSPGTTEYYLQKANVFLQMRNIDEAHYWFTKSLETTSRQVLVLMCIGGDYVYAEQYEAAIEFFEKASLMTDDPTHVKAYAYLAYLYWRLKDSIKFRSNLRIACEKTPETVKSFWGEILNDVPESMYYYVLQGLAD